MKSEVETTRFGRIEIDDDRVLHFPKGLIGLERLKRFALLDSTRGDSIQWLQSLDEPAMAFLVSEPKKTFPFIEITLPSPQQVQSLFDKTKLDELKLLTILHVNHEEKRLHVNIQAPLLINPLTQKGVQVITDSSCPTVALPLKGA